MQVRDKNLLIPDDDDNHCTLSFDVSACFSTKEDIYLKDSRFEGFKEVDESKTLSAVYETIREAILCREDGQIGHTSFPDTYILKDLVDEALTAISDFCLMQSKANHDD